MKGFALAVAAFLISLPGSACARETPSDEDRAAFRAAVDDYQIFVVPHCAPDDVGTYVAARAERDQAFIDSLRDTVLKDDYEKAVADRASRDRQTVYECFGAPPPPGQLPPDAAELERRHKAGLADHFAGGDRQFTRMMQLRDRLIGQRGVK